MNSFTIRRTFLNFFKERGHKIVPSSSLLSVDPTVLFTTAGMQQFKEYFLGKPCVYGKRVTSCQKCFRTSDIEKVGDTTHLCFLEMLGNFSFGDYFKKETIEFALEFLTKKCGLDIKNLWISYFKGDKEVPEDKESKQIWLKLGIPEQRIYGFSREENFWGPTGIEGPCGPTTEIHYDLTGKPCEKGSKCIPNCDCGRFVEIWNLVFNEYYQSSNKKLTLLKQKGVDTGMGLERLTMVLQKDLSVFETDLFWPIIKEIIVQRNNVSSYEQDPRFYRIIADHIKASVFLASEGVIPSNVEEGYVLRKILRRAVRFGKLLNLSENFLIPVSREVIKIYENVYPELKSNQAEILTIIQKEGENFNRTLEKGLKQFKKLLKAKAQDKIISGEEAFNIYQSYGFPLELIEELAREEGFDVDKEKFFQALKKHQEVSRAGAEKKFGGHNIETIKNEEEKRRMIKLHTATHLLQQALRQVLGKEVKQMGSDINPERLRFDFSYPQKISSEQLKEVENLVNQKIKEDLEVRKEEVSYEQAIKSGALAFFKEKYPEKVTVYSIGNFSVSPPQIFSKEICAGPHVNRTSELGCFKIVKERSSGLGVRRIKAVLEPKIKD